MRKQFAKWWDRNILELWDVHKDDGEKIYKAGFRAGRKRGKAEEKVRQFKSWQASGQYGVTRTRGPKVRIKDTMRDQPTGPGIPWDKEL